MNLVKKLPFKSFDHVAVGACFVLFIACSLGIHFEDKWINKLITVKKQNNKPIGYITAITDGVKRKIFGDVIWAPFEDDANVFNGDKIFTDKNSTTQVYIQSTGVQITLEPESLVQLSDEEMNLENGNFEIKLFGNKPTTIRSGNQKITLSSTKGLVKLKQNKLKSTVEVDIIDGDVNIITKSGKEFIKKGTKYNVDQTGKVFEHNVEKISLKTFYPKNKQELKYTEIKPVSFLWQHIEEAEEYTIEVAANRNFESPLLTTQTKEPKYVLNNLDTGKYFWRAKVKSKDYSDWSTPSEFNILIDKPIVKEEPKVEPPKPKVAKKAPPKIRKPASKAIDKKQLGKAKAESVEFVEE